ncbi:NAD(P)/FAD-dependent oxidoreductase [Devriesea agamarum]|uniref:NAD(P)/FAD-dependent oxidoreductase n=1 Tax=Devriesea agamarum TaxID=472569 RepID=UPI00071D667B|nr:NAD(P)/FAD-dependent oxidoreductase [Devriesea agamarum]
MTVFFSHKRRTVPAKDGASWPHVIVVGGGFAGASLVQALRDTRVRVTLIDRNVYKTFQPLLYQVATAGLNPGDVTMFLRGLSLKLPNMRYWQGELTGIDQASQEVVLRDGTRMHYDQLVIATGATTNFFHTTGGEEHAMPMYTRSQALAIRDRIFAELERASRSRGQDHLCVSIVGGGPTGVEIAGALADFRMQELDILYPEMDPGTLEISIIQRGADLLKPYRENFRQYAADELRARGVVLRTGHGVKEVGYDYVVLDNDEIVESDITIWAAGVSATPDVKNWGLPQGKGGRIETDEHCRVSGTQNIYAAGDIAAMPEVLPQLAQPAIQTGQHIAKVIRATLRGEEPPAFSYRDFGTMATIGRHAAIAQIPGAPDLSGSIGWVAWIAIHVKSLIGHRNRRAVLMNLLSLYSGNRHTHQPNPVVGEINSEEAAAIYEAMRDLRRFGGDKR